MIEVASGQLWIGNALDAREPRPLFEYGISAVVDLAYEEVPAQLPRPLIYCRFPLLDGEGNDPAVVKIALQTVSGLVRSSVPTLVACSAGMSRSPTVAAFALAHVSDTSPEQIIQHIGTLRTLDVKPVLWTDIQREFHRL